MKSRSRTLFDKSLQSMLSAIEIYNKPDFAYREETFSILTTNAWELMFKARILQLENNRLASIMVYEYRKNVDGTKSKNRFRKKNRSGNTISIGLFHAYDRLVNNYKDKIDPVIKANLDLMVEIRDNSVHFINNDPQLALKIHEIGSACLQNYFVLARRWFGVDLSKYRFFILPVSFFSPPNSFANIPQSGRVNKLLKYVKKVQEENSYTEQRDFDVSIQISLKMTKSKTSDVANIVKGKDSDAVKIALEESDIRELYPLDYRTLTEKLSKRYSNFIQNSNYHAIRKKLEENKKFCLIRLLDPGNPNGSKKKFYNSNIIKEFDKYYSRFVSLFKEHVDDEIQKGNY